MTGPPRTKSPAPVCQLAGAAEIKGADFDDEDTPLFPRLQRPLRPPPPWPVIDDLPVGFNPADHPIIAMHFFGVDPFERTTDANLGVVALATSRR